MRTQAAPYATGTPATTIVDAEQSIVVLIEPAHQRHTTGEVAAADRLPPAACRLPPTQSTDINDR
ncbi:hypothetical protein [Streptomyces triticisoli]|uniref:hypothetical protein n=1 Tax=Streptomyces triticisoli TaxID=2182797 RepID=UPI0013008BDD|nr:hypothetical protein [Streptomyces triticisoli]